MTRTALARLYPGQVPQRGEVQAALAPESNSAERDAFAATWQSWVRAMLIDHADDPALIRVEG